MRTNWKLIHHDSTCCVVSEQVSNHQSMAKYFKMTQRLMRWWSIRRTKSCNIKIATKLKTAACPSLLTSLPASSHFLVTLSFDRIDTQHAISFPNKSFPREEIPQYFPGFDYKDELGKCQFIYLPNLKESTFSFLKNVYYGKFSSICKRENVMMKSPYLASTVNYQEPI